MTLTVAPRASTVVKREVTRVPERRRRTPITRAVVDSLSPSRGGRTIVRWCVACTLSGASSSAIVAARRARATGHS